MIITYVLTLVLISIVIGIIVAWRKEVKGCVSDKQKTIAEVRFYDDRAPKPATWASNVPNLDQRVSGAVRYNQSMYYDKEEFEKIKEQTLSKIFPVYDV